MTTRTHDHELKIDSTTKRLYLVRDDQGKAMYTVLEDVPNYKAELQVQQTNWINGHGQYSLDDLEMYFDGQSIDTTQDGRVILGPLINTVQCKNFLDACQADDGGSFTNELSASQNTTANDMTLTPAVPVVNDAYYFGSDATFTQIDVNIGTQGVGSWTITWEYYNGSSWTAVSGLSDGTTGFTATTGIKSVTFTLPGDWATVAVNSVTKYWVRARVSAFTSVTTQPLGTQAWVTKSGLTMGEAPVVFSWFSATTKWYCGTTTKIFEYDGTYWLQRWVISAQTITDIKEFNSILYVGLGTSTLWYYTANGTSYTQTDLTNAKTEKFFVAPNLAGTADVLWTFRKPNELYSTTDGRTSAGGGAALSSVAYIGDSSANITHVFLIGDELQVGREDNLFNYDSNGGIHPEMDELKQARSTLNFQYVTMWQACVYFSRMNSLGEISVRETFNPIGPLEKTIDIGKSGNCVGLTSDTGWLYVAMDEGTNTHIYKGREISTAKGLKWQWCPWVFVGTNACAAIAHCQHTTTDRRVWFGYGNNAAYVTVTDNPTSDSAARFAASGWVRMSYIYGSNPFWDKMFQSIVTETKGCSATETVQPKYRKDTDTSMTNLTAAITSNGVAKTNFTTALSAKRIQFELDLATGTNTTTPEVLMFTARGTEKPETVRVREAYYAMGDNPSTRTETVKTFLNGGRTSTSLIKFADLRYGEDTAGTSSGDYVWCVMQPGFPKEVEIVHEKGRQPELAMQVRLQEISFTIS